MPTRLLLADIIAAVARRYGMKPEDLRRRTNRKEYVRPRQMAIYLMRQLTDASFPKIGGTFGKHHTSILDSYQVFERRLLQEPELRAMIDTLIAELTANRAA